jgi:hypothetical protein
MNGLTSNYYNLINESNINTNNIIVSGKFQGSDASFYNGITSNIQQQINGLSNNSISGSNQNVINNYITNSLSGFIQTVNSISGKLSILYGDFNSTNIINNKNFNDQYFFNNSISGIIFNLPKSFNFASYNDILTLSGLINYNYNDVNFRINSSINNQNGINNNQNNSIDSLQSQINNNNRKQSQSSDGNTAGNIVNGIGTFTVGLASAILISALFSSVASLQATVTTLNIYVEDLSERVSQLILKVRENQQDIRYLKADVKDLKNRCQNLNVNSFNSDIYILGNISQTKPNSENFNTINSNTIFYKNVQVVGLLLDDNQKINDQIQF